MGEEFLSKNNGYWYVSWYERNISKPKSRSLKKRPLKKPDGKTLKITMRKCRDNRDEAVLLWQRGRDATVPLPDRHKTTFEDFLPVFRQYLVDKGKKTLTINLYSYDVNKAKEHLPYCIQDVRLAHIEEYLGSLSVKPSTKAKYAKSLSRFFKVAKIKGLILTNPVEGFEFAPEKVIVNPFTEEQIRKLLRAARELEINFNEPYYTFIHFAFQTGLRLNEYVNLRWKYLDLKKGEYEIFQDETFDPKHSRKRTIRIPQTSVNLLRKLSQDSEYIFHKKGKRHHHFCRDFSNNIFKAAGVEGDLHQIRKTFASYRLACGYPLQNLQADLGHRSLKELQAYVGIIKNVSAEMKKLFSEY